MPQPPWRLRLVLEEMTLNEWSTVGTDISNNQVSTKATAAAKELGYDKLKELQLRVVIGFCQGRDLFAVLPTGYGKSLCYGCLPWIYDSIFKTPIVSVVVLVSPLTAVIEEQVYRYSY